MRGKENTMKYYSYYVEGCENESKWKKILSCLIDYSDEFSLIYYKPDGKANSTAKKMIKSLSKYKIESRTVTCWPGTTILDEDEKSYKLYLFKSDREVYEQLAEVPTLWDWDGFDYPMDIAFYKNGYAWFASCSHEHLNWLYLQRNKDFPSASFFENNGLQIFSDIIVDESELFSYILEYKERDGSNSKRNIEHVVKKDVSFQYLEDIYGESDVSVSIKDKEIRITADRNGLMAIGNQFLNMLQIGYASGSEVVVETGKGKGAFKIVITKK
ncbi:hypothetical protein [Butyrivibrio sp. MC2013]|uniref:hypothetical protein n=1 Tax=Butyrivibrio sp. MC2013 TaxID=1280686 RepID=UPI0018C9038A|nr:hypothetical protein [Butyrivibrio sp. MC2013]